MKALGLLDALGPTAGLADDRDAVIVVQDGPEPYSNHLMVVDQKQANGGRSR